MHIYIYLIYEGRRRGKNSKRLVVGSSRVTSELKA